MSGLAGKRSPLTIRESIAVGVFVVGAVGWALNLKYAQIATQATVDAHSVQLSGIEGKQQIEHDLLIELKTEAKATRQLVEYLANGRRGNPPVAVTSVPGSP